MIQYKSVPGPVGITISRKEDFASAVKQYASIIDRESVGGWKFECIRKIPVTKKAGCLASLFGKEDTTLYMNMLVFSKDDSDHISYVRTLTISRPEKEVRAAVIDARIDTVAGAKDLAPTERKKRKMNL